MKTDLPQPITPSRSTYILPTSSFLLVCVVLHLVLIGDIVWQKSPTVDEIAHLPAGLSYLQTGDFRAYALSPPLARLLPALAAWPLGISLDLTGSWEKSLPNEHWSFAFQTMAANAETPLQQQRYLQAFTAARGVTACWSALAIPFLFWWGRWWFGRDCGYLTAALWTLCPNIQAHASLVTTDVAAASTGLIASYFFARWLDRPTWLGLWRPALGLGLAQLVKFSSLWLYLAWFLWLLVFTIWHGRQQKQTFWQTATSLGMRLGQWLLIVLLSIVIIDLGYLGQGVGRPIGTLPFACDSLTRPRLASETDPYQWYVAEEVQCNLEAFRTAYTQRVNRFRHTWFHHIPCPLPYHFVTGFDRQKFEAEGKYEVYLNGTLRTTGWWYYYLEALALKLPIATILLLALSLIRHRFFLRSGSRQGLVWLFFVAGPLFAMMALTDINLGVRYTLPIFPFLFLLAGALLADFPTNKPQSAEHATAPEKLKWQRFLLSQHGWRWFVGLLVLWNAWEVWRIHPHQLSYFHEWVRTPSAGRYYLIDSNLDWGQDLRSLARWLEKHPDWQSARFAYWGNIPPEFEGIKNYRLAPRLVAWSQSVPFYPGENPQDPTTYGPQPGKFIVSVNFECGLAWRPPCPWSERADLEINRPDALLRHAGGLFLTNTPTHSYSYFQYFTPQVKPRLGYSLLLYDITLEEANRVRQQLNLPLLSP